MPTPGHKNTSKNKIPVQFEKQLLITYYVLGALSSIASHRIKEDGYHVL